MRQVDLMGMDSHGINAVRNCFSINQDNQVFYIPTIIQKLKAYSNRNQWKMDNLNPVKVPLVFKSNTFHFEIGFINIRSLASKALLILIHDLILEHDFNIFGLCETQLSTDNAVPLAEASPPNFLHCHVTHANKKGGSGCTALQLQFLFSSQN